MASERDDDDPEREEIRESTGKSSLTISRSAVGVWGYVSALDREGRTIWIVDAHGYGNRFIVRAEEILTCVFGTGKGRYTSSR